jgi:hypothetical protein
MNDRELLELAAKAAGIELSDWSSSENGFIRIHFITRHIWNPLTDDGDALRLAVKLAKAGRISGIELFPTFVIAHHHDNVSGYKEQEHYDNDPYAATRRAIVRAAAEIGRAMK